MRAAGMSIIGHSERRQFFGETDETVEKKTRAAIGGELHAIVCVGETLAERDAGQAAEVVRRQIQEGLGKFSAAELSRITIAYEPVWAIGTGRTATPEIAAEMHGEIRKTIRRFTEPERLPRFASCMVEASSRTTSRR